MSTSYAPTRIEVFRPAIGEDEIDAVADVMRSGWIGRGPKVDQLEAAFAEFIGVPREHVVSTNSATEALFLVMQAIGRQHRHQRAHVVMPDIGYIGTANAIQKAGMYCDPCDVDPRTLNPTVRDLELAVQDNTAAVVIQHYGGVPSDLAAIVAMCNEREITLVSDCACAPVSMAGAMYAGTAGDFGVWSFDAMKVLTAGDGGMLYCRNGSTAERIRRATLLGQDTASGRESSSDRWWEFTIEEPGRRAIMNDIQAAIGLVQLGKLPHLVARRRAIWDSYQRALANIDWIRRPPDPETGVRSSYYTYWVQLERRDDLANFLRSVGIYTTFRYWPVHRAYGWQADVPGADWAAAHTLNLPLHPGLSDDDVDHVCEQIQAFGNQP